MKRNVLMAMLCVMGLQAWAQTPAEVELLSAQKSYQQALSLVHSNKSTLKTKQDELVVAKQRLEAAQQSVNQLQQEVTRLQDAQQAAEGQLQSLGARLDQAWSAAKP